MFNHTNNTLQVNRDSDVDAHGHDYIYSKEAGFSACLSKSEQLQQAEMIYHYNERCLQLPTDELIKYKAFGSIDERDPSPPLTLWKHHELSSFWSLRLDFVQIFPQSPFDQPLCRRGTGFKFHLSPTSNSSNSLHHLTGDGSSPREGALLFAQQSWWQYWNHLLMTRRVSLSLENGDLYKSANANSNVLFSIVSNFALPIWYWIFSCPEI